jgi:hypothetical protein
VGWQMSMHLPPVPANGFSTYISPSIHSSLKKIFSFDFNLSPTLAIISKE